MDINSEYLINTIAAVINKIKPPNPPETINWKTIFELANFHSVTNIVYCGLRELPLEIAPDFETMSLFNEEYRLMYAKDSIQQVCSDAIFNELETRKIPALVLNGWHVKHLYPSTNLRSMNDVDLLVRDPKLMYPIMKALGYQKIKTCENYDLFYKEPIMHLKVLKQLVKADSKFFAPLLSIWNNAVPFGKYNYINILSPEWQYVFNIIRLKIHYDNSGIGIRSVLDIYILKKSEEVDWEAVEKELERLSLLDFAKQIESLADLWFGWGEDTPELDELARYVLSSGAYGTIQNFIAKKVDSYDGSKSSYIFKRLFPPLSFMKERFPSLARAPFLLPFYWIARIFSGPLKNREYVSTELKYIFSK